MMYNRCRQLIKKELEFLKCPDEPIILNLHPK